MLPKTTLNFNEFQVSGELHVIVESVNHFLRAWHTDDIKIVFGPFNGRVMTSLRSQNPSKQDIDQTTVFTRQKRDMIVKTQPEREKAITAKEGTMQKLNKRRT